MPSPKRWMPISRDINDDDEFNELSKRFGVAGVRIFLEVMAVVDKTDNCWRLSGDFLGRVARKCRTTRNIVQRVLQLFLDFGWIRLSTLSDQSLIYEAPNYWKYRKRRESKESQPSPLDAPDKGPLLTFPNLSFPKEDKESPPTPSSPVENSQGQEQKSKEFSPKTSQEELKKITSLIPLDARIDSGFSEIGKIVKDVCERTHIKSKETEFHS